jgi:hypothetical protein
MLVPKAASASTNIRTGGSVSFGCVLRQICITLIDRFQFAGDGLLKCCEIFIGVQPKSYRVAIEDGTHVVIGLGRQALLPKVEVASKARTLVH